MELRAFLELNEAMAMRALLDQVLGVEKLWDDSAQRREAIQKLFELLDATVLHRSPLIQGLGALRSRVPEDPSYHQFLAIFVPIERQHARMVADGDFLIRSEDAGSVQTRTFPLCLVLDNIRSAFNVGSILRTAESLGLERVYLCGYTARPDNDRVAKAALGAESKIPWEWCAHADDLLTGLRGEAVSIYALETASTASPLEGMAFPRRASVLVLGNERYGLEEKTLRLCDVLIEIPAWGSKNSINVAVSAGIAAYEMRRQWCRD